MENHMSESEMYYELELENIIKEQEKNQETIREEYELVSEGLLNGNPKEIDNLSKTIRVKFKDFSKKEKEKFKGTSLKSRLGTSLKSGGINKEMSSAASFISSVGGITIISNYFSTTYYNGSPLYRTHYFLALYKDYVIKISINGFNGFINGYGGISTVYDPDKSKFDKDIIKYIVTQLKGKDIDISKIKNSISIRLIDDPIDSPWVNSLISNIENKYPNLSAKAKFTSIKITFKKNQSDE